MTAEELFSKVIKNFPGATFSSNEVAAIINTLKAGADYGYGNLMAWLATAWAVRLREDGFSEADALLVVTARTPYPLPK